MKKLMSIALALIFLFSLAACSSSAQQQDATIHITENETVLYPLTTEENLYSTSPSLSDILFTTTGEENGLEGTLYSFTGEMLGNYDELDSTFFVVETNRGKVLMSNIYLSIKDEMPTISEDSYSVPAIGEIARFTCIYSGFSGVADMPMFLYGNDELLLSLFTDDPEESESAENSTPESNKQEDSAVPNNTTPAETQPPAHKHSYTSATCLAPATCNCGATNGSALGHSFTQGKCSRCGATDPNYNPISVSKRNALEEAKSYLRYSAFSYLGLIDQLEYEGYPYEDAVYGVDNCGANWNEQALKSAKSYLNYTAFSYSGLIDQLEYEEFTAEQAKYGADNCGADWNEQAAKSAKSYLKYSSFSRQGLIDQLLYEGFTYDQAVYGVTAAGL